MKMAKNYSSIRMTRGRELGQIFKEDTLLARYYKHIKFKSSWTTDGGVNDHGSIFNLEFSPSGKMMVAACEKAAILIFDPFSRTLLSKISQAHNDSVNCICFLDERTFASGSDDFNITLWDARMLREKIMNFEGHTSWVKSLVYNKTTLQLVTSGFDGTIRVWDINKYFNTKPQSKVIFTAEHLTRMQLSSAGDKLIMSTLGGSVTVFHDLNLETFQEDINRRGLANHLNASHSSQKSFPFDRNFPETIVEFPRRPWCISSLQVHPHGWCLMSRFTRRYMRLEYTTIHDIQTIPNEKFGQERTKNVKRLSHYIEESNAGPGFIKEQDFSQDGRLMASPFGNGARLLAFGDDCCELCKCDPDSPVPIELHEIKYLLSHHHPVCTSKFSPTHMQVATGCLGGKIAFHEPKLS